jgi:hypothetical protein
MRDSLPTNNLRLRFRALLHKGGSRNLEVSDLKQSGMGRTSPSNSRKQSSRGRSRRDPWAPGGPAPFDPVALGRLLRASYPAPGKLGTSDTESG